MLIYGLFISVYSYAGAQLFISGALWDRQPCSRGHSGEGLVVGPDDLSALYNLCDFRSILKILLAE